MYTVRVQVHRGTLQGCNAPVGVPLSIVHGDKCWPGHLARVQRSRQRAQQKGGLLQVAALASLACCYGPLLNPNSHMGRQQSSIIKAQLSAAGWRAVVVGLPKCNPLLQELSLTAALGCLTTEGFCRQSLQ